MMAVARLLWFSAVDLYRELGLLVRANVVWLLLSLPMHAVIFASALWVLASIADPESTPVLAPIFLTAFLGLLLPFPPSAGMRQLGLVMLDESPASMGTYWAALRQFTPQTLLMFIFGLFGIAIGLANLHFYLGMEGGLQLLALPWLYALLLWLALQPYLLGELLLQPGSSFPTLYGRATKVVLKQPLPSLLLLAAAATLALASIFAPPLYALVGMAYFSLLAARAARGRTAVKPRSGEQGQP